MIVYCLPHRRRPVTLTMGNITQDPQGAIPMGWCENCASEIFAADEILCPRCKQRKERSK